MRLLWAAVGGLGLILAVIGIALPIMPTVPFLLLSAWAFARSSPRLHAWLMNHPRFGPPLRAWRRHRAISRRAKTVALLGMAAGIAVGGLVLTPALWLLQAAIIAAAAAFVASRPAPPPEGADVVPDSGPATGLDTGPATGPDRTSDRGVDAAAGRAAALQRRQ